MDISCRSFTRQANTRRAALIALLSFSAFSALDALALPVFPGAIGYGTDTPAGRGAANDANHIYEVTSLDDNSLSSPNPGTLRYGVEKVNDARVIIFRVSGVVALRGDLKIRPSTPSANHGNLTIAGQTAPFPGITLKNGGIRVSAQHVLIQHIAIRPGQFETTDPSYDLSVINNRDCIRVEGDGVDHVVVDHISCSWSTDETASTWWGPNKGTITNVTLINSVFADPIQFSGHTDENGVEEQHGFGVLIGHGTSNMSIIRNVMAFNWSRNPLIRGNTSGAQIVNNLIYKPGPFSNAAMYVGSHGGYDQDPPVLAPPYSNFPMTVSAIGNVALRTPALVWGGKNRDAHLSGMYVHANSTSDLTMYLEGNYSRTLPSGSWNPASSDLTAQYSAPFFIGKQPEHKVFTSDPYAYSGGTTWSPLSGSPESIIAQVVPNAGKFPGQRDSIDSTLFAKINDPNDQSTWLEHIADLGTDPWHQVDIRNDRTFTVPANPGGDTDSDGYTNLEEALHRQAAVVEAQTDGYATAFDTFTDGNSTGWTTAVAGATGTWSVSGAALRQSNNTQNGRAVLSGTNWTDQVVQSDVQVNSFSGNGFVAVYGRFRSFNDTYYLTLRNTGVVELKRVKTNASGVAVITTFGTWTMPTPNFAVPHYLKLVLNGNTLQGYVDGTLRVSGTDNDDGFVSGSAAVGGYLADVSFDNLFASANPAAVKTVVDDFDDNNSTGWVTNEAGLTGSWSVTTDPSGSTNRVLTQSSSTGNARATYQTSKNDQSTQARVKVTSAAANGFVAVYARYQNYTNAYYVALRNNGTLEIMKIINNIAAPIATVTLPATFDLTTWHTLRIDVSGSSTVQLHAYLDGQMRLSGKDTTNVFTSGLGSVGGYLAAAKWDDIVLTSP